ncbi:Organic cation transporter protein [Hordeum vulgare]|nr:Organic cation transporter protein [Hordeum vulgare]
MRDDGFKTFDDDPIADVRIIYRWGSSSARHLAFSAGVQWLGTMDHPPPRMDWEEPGRYVAALDLKDEELDDVVVGEEESNPAAVVLDGVHAWAQIHGIPDMYRSTDIVDQLARRIGRVKEIQLSPRLFYAGDYVRVRARILVSKALTRVTALSVMGEGRRMFPVKHEKTPYLCQVCGLMGHNYEECGDGVWETKQKQ